VFTFVLVIVLVLEFTFASTDVAECLHRVIRVKICAQQHAAKERVFDSQKNKSKGGHSCVFQTNMKFSQIRVEDGTQNIVGMMIHIFVRHAAITPDPIANNKVRESERGK
jgi:hypothetical protein